MGDEWSMGGRWRVVAMGRGGDGEIRGGEELRCGGNDWINGAGALFSLWFH